MKTLKIIIAILLFAVLIVGAYVLYNSLSDQVQLGGLVTQNGSSGETRAPEAPAAPDEPVPETTEAPRKHAPDFTFYDYDGNAYSLSDFEGKPVILNFWASWCGPCKMEMPDFQAAFDKYGDDVHFIMLNMTDGFQETVDSATKFIEKEGYTFPVYYDKDTEGALVMGIGAVPITFFIDSDGYFEAYFQGAMPADVLQQGVDILLGNAE